MCPADISSLKWSDDGELSPNDTLNLMEKLARAEQDSKEPGRVTLNSSSISPEDHSLEPSLLDTLKGRRAVPGSKTEPF